MDAKELKMYLLEDTDRIISLLEDYGFHDAWLNGEEIRCATPTGSNRTSVSIKLVDELYATSFDDEFSFRGDFFGLLQEASDTNFASVMRGIHDKFNLPYTGRRQRKRLDLLKDVRRFKRGSNQDVEIKKYDKSELDQFIRKPHASMIEEAISPQVLEQFDIMFDPRRDRIVFPHYHWDDGALVGIQGRTTLPSELASELGVLKYLNLIRGHRKSSNLYGFNLAKQHLEDSKMLVIFEGEKSVLKLFTQERTKGYAVALGGHKISQEQVNIILRETPVDTEIVIALDKDIMANEDYLIEQCKKFSKFRKASYIYDKYDILGEKDAPIDLGVKIWRHLLKYRVEVNE